MKIKCYAYEYAGIPEYLEIKDSEDKSYMISLGDTENEDETSFECPDAELLGDIADEYESETECLENILASVVNDFECGLFWEKIIFTDDAAEITYSVKDNEIKIEINKFRTNNQEQEEQDKNSNNKEPAESVNLEEVEENKTENIQETVQKEPITSLLFDDLKPDGDYIEEKDIIIVDGQKYCSFKKLAELTESLSADDRVKLMKSINHVKETTERNITPKRPERTINKSVMDKDEGPEL